MPVHVLLAVDNLLLLHIEGDDRELADARIAEDTAQDGDQRARIQRLQVPRKASSAARS